MTRDIRLTLSYFQSSKKTSLLPFIYLNLRSQPHEVKFPLWPPPGLDAPVYNLNGSAAEETEFDYPLGPIGGSFHIIAGKHLVRVTEVMPDAPGDVAGLMVDDFIYGAFGKPFDPMSEL